MDEEGLCEVEDPNICWLTDAGYKLLADDENERMRNETRKLDAEIRQHLKSVPITK
jgi:hypothetical protein